MRTFTVIFLFGLIFALASALQLRNQKQNKACLNMLQQTLDNCKKKCNGSINKSQKSWLDNCLGECSRDHEKNKKKC